MIILERIKNNLTAYQLFAITVVGMIIGHLAFYFFPDHSWLRVHDRILVPVFLVSVGYNAGHKLSELLIIGALLVTGLHYLVFGDIFVTVLGTIVLVRYLIEPLAEHIFKSKEVFWITNLILIVLYPLSSSFVEYGTLALFFALTGWMIKNSQSIDKNIIKPLDYTILVFAIYMVIVKMKFGFSAPQMAVTVLGASIVFYLLYNMRDLLMNSIRHKPTDIIGKTCKYIGKKSLEIYLLHLIALMLIYYYFVLS